MLRVGSIRLIPADPVLAARVRAAAYVIACDVHPSNNLRVMNVLKASWPSEADVMAWYQHWILNYGLEALEKLVGESLFCFGVSLDGLERLCCHRRTLPQPTTFDLARPELQPNAD